MKTTLPVLLSIFAFAATALSAEPTFILKDGDTVALLGDAFIEREQYEGWIELAATTQFPDQDVKFRNLGWSADTPAGKSRRGLSLEQAGLEAEGEGWKQLQNQLKTYKPNVIILGYGMASSLPNGETPGDFRGNFHRLLDEAPKATGNDVRFLILGPPPRFAKNQIDPADLEKHRASLSAVTEILSTTAKERGIPYVSLSGLAKKPDLSENGIHLTAEGYKATARLIENALGWQAGKWDEGEAAKALRQRIILKNEWFFNRSRPANMAYIFGFRAKEQGRNAEEIPRFDAMVAREEAAIAKTRDLAKGEIIQPFPQTTASKTSDEVTQPHPTFTVAEGFEVSLWAENPLLHKPTQVNFDTKGRLWVASSETYPQVEVGQTPNDKVIILEDTTGDGSADKSTVFADRLLMPTGILPDTKGGAYVAQSTDFLHFTDADGDGKADSKTRVLSGFGTEDTHHNLHTLRRGPDGQIWMAQSLYTRSNVETPHGIVRLDSGGVFRFDPSICRLEVVYRGLWNPWGHQFDEFGQSFLTDGAGFNGINWGLRDVMYMGFAGAQRILGSISPGAYPKFCGLEIIGSDHFPDDWQGNLITNDFRAHRVVRFSIADNGAGYVTQELEDLLRSESVSFRPIDVKTGPDGALYIADWANPIINHGEVDFRDPRRDRVHGRIWRVSRKGTSLEKSPPLTESTPEELGTAIADSDPYIREQATSILSERGKDQIPVMANPTSDTELLAALRLNTMRGETDFATIREAYKSTKGEIRAAAIPHLGEAPLGSEAMELLTSAISDPFPRVRIEAIRVLSEKPGAESLDLALEALSSDTDRFIEYALWLNIQESGADWLASLGKEPSQAKLEFVLANLPPSEASDTISRLFPDKLPSDGSGPWLSLGLITGNDEVISKIYARAVAGGFDETTRKAAINGVNQAILQRGIRPIFEPKDLVPLLEKKDETAIELAGTLASPALLSKLAELTGSTPPGLAAIRALGNYSDDSVKDILLKHAGDSEQLPARIASAVALARFHREAALPVISSVAAGFSEPTPAREFWQQVLALKDISPQLAATFEATPIPKKSASVALRAIPDIADHDTLLKILRHQAGEKESEKDMATRVSEITTAAKEGDPHKGEFIYRRAALACIACHAIGGVGGLTGPDMTSIGSSAPLDYLVESVLNPGAKVKEGYHSVMVETTDGRAISGRLLVGPEDGLKIRDAAGKEIVIPNDLIAKKTDAGSLMPSGLVDSLKDDETADLFAFLGSLGKPGDFSANDSNSPKVYAFIDRTPENLEASARGDGSLPWKIINATVNGRLTTEDYFAAGGRGYAVIIATKLQLTEESDINLVFSEKSRPAELYINGRTSTGKVRLPAGIHKIIFRIDRIENPIQLSSDKGTFLPKW